MRNTLSSEDSTMSQEAAETRLKRTIGLTGMVFYGVGTMIGGGFYALLGKMVGFTGIFTPLSLLPMAAKAEGISWAEPWASPE